jgi:hypothetical protein
MSVTRGAGSPSKFLEYVNQKFECADGHRSPAYVVPNDHRTSTKALNEWLSGCPNHKDPTGIHLVTGS